MIKTYKKKTTRGKTYKKKTYKRKIYRKNKKIRGGFEIVDRGSYRTIQFSENDKEEIKKYFKIEFENGRDQYTITSRELIDTLFPSISEDLRSNAGYEINQILVPLRAQYRRY